MDKNREGQRSSYDKAYKELLQKERNFLELIQSFINEDWVKGVDENCLEKADKEFVTPEFDKRESDIVYRLNLKDREVIFYCLLEMQSSVDFTMPFRLLCYIVELLREVYRNTDEKERERKGFRFPAVVPIVLYNGEANWTALKEFKKVFKSYKEFGNHLLDFEYLLIDVNSYSDEELLEVANVISSIFYLDQKGEVDVLQRLKDLVDIMKNMSEEEFTSIKRWLINISAPLLPAGKKEELERIIEESKPWEVENMISKGYGSSRDNGDNRIR